MLKELVLQHLKKLKITLLFKIIILLLLFFYVFYFLNNKQHLSKYNGDEKDIIGYIKNIELKDNKVTLIIKAKENLLVNYYLKQGEVFTFQLGDKVFINGILSKPNNSRNFNSFNYQKYLLTKKIYYVLKASEIEKIKNNQNFLYFLKQKLIDRTQNISQSSYLKAFILGDKSDIDDDINNSYQNNGISHLLAISGMHITILTMLLLKLLNKLTKRQRMNEIIVIFFLIFYAFITSFSVSVIRTSLMFILGVIFQKKVNIREIFLITLIITLFINPFYLYSVSFKYSFIVSFYLIIFRDLINNRKHYISKIFMTSLIAFLGSIPIQINNFYNINFLSVFLNIIFVPFFTIIIFPLSLLTFICPFLIDIFAFLIKIFENLSIFFNSFNYFTFNFSSMPVIFVIYYYIVITFILFEFQKKQYKYFFILLISFIIHYNINYFKNYATITMLDVGQGDSILISLKHNEGNILIDTGGIVNYYGNSYSLAKKTLIPYFKSLGIRKIDYLILTHGDYDHMGEAINLVNNFKVENVIFNSDDYNSLETELIDVLNKKKIKYYKGRKELDINHSKLYFLNNNEYDNENDNSNVLYFKLNNYKFLFMGDAGINREKAILEKYNLNDIDFMKIGHHGSNTSSSKDFIDSIKPKYCLISVGKNNRYGHPKESVLETLDDYCNIYRTDLNGSIEIKINKNNYKIKTYSS